MENRRIRGETYVSVTSSTTNPTSTGRVRFHVSHGGSRLTQLYWERLMSEYLDISLSSVLPLILSRHILLTYHRRYIILVTESVVKLNTSCLFLPLLIWAFQTRIFFYIKIRLSKRTAYSSYRSPYRDKIL